MFGTGPVTAKHVIIRNWYSAGCTLNTYIYVVESGRVNNTHWEAMAAKRTEVVGAKYGT